MKNLIIVKRATYGLECDYVMLCRVSSCYPNGVDPMLFFQDNDLEKIDIMNTYNKLISQGKYTEASEYISQQEGVYGYFADFLMQSKIGFIICKIIFSTDHPSKDSLYILMQVNLMKISNLILKKVCSGYNSKINFKI